MTALWKDRVPNLMDHANHELTVADIVPALVEKAHVEEKVVFVYDGDYSEDIVKEGLSYEDVLAKFEELGLKRFMQTRARGEGSTKYYFSSDESLMSFNLRRTSQGPKILAPSLATMNDDLHARFRALLKDIIVKIDPEKGYIYTLRRTSEGFELSPLGLAGNTLVRENYAPEILTGYDHIIADLKAENPCGRLSVLSGPPGCGKTWMIRAMLKDVVKAKFVLVSPSLVPSLGDPSLLPDLKTAVSLFDGPMILVLEDADACLVPRMGDNMQAVQSLLNASDGIIGSTLDIRVIATTNAKGVSLDRALVRPGRLCTHLDVEGLHFDQANAIYNRLMGTTGEKPFLSNTPLAEVYLRAKRGSQKPVEATRIGL